MTGKRIISFPSLQYFWQKGKPFSEIFSPLPEIRAYFFPKRIALRRDYQAA